MIVNPVGIDKPIQEMQQLFIANLWTDVPDDKKQFNHRVFRNEDRNGNLIPEIYLNNGEYQEVKFNDNLDVLSWFDVADTTTSYQLGQINQIVGVFFAVNLESIHSTLTHRAVEETHLDVQQILLKRTEFEITEIITGQEAYGDFNVENLKFPNKQPWHVFKFNCNVKYSLNC